MIHAFKFTRIFLVLCRGFDQIFLKYKKIIKNMKIFLIILLNLIKWVNFKTFQLNFLPNSSF